MKLQYFNFSRHAVTCALSLLTGILLIGNASMRAETGEPELPNGLLKSFVVTSSDARHKVDRASFVASGKAQDQCNGFHGVWNIVTDKNDKGSMTLQQRRTSVRGTYKVGTLSGTISGTVKDGVLNFKWQSGGYSESGHFTLSTDCKSFTGSWNAITRVIKWNGTRAQN